MSGHTMEFGSLLNGYMSLDYATMMASFETNPEAWPPAPPPNGTPARRLKDAITPLAEHAYWSRRTNEAIAKLGLGFVPGYVYGRAAALGEPPADVVVAALAVFEPPPAECSLRGSAQTMRTNRSARDARGNHDR